MRNRTFTQQEADDFWLYFNIADELWDGLTPEDLDPKAYFDACVAARQFNLPTRPYLPHAEEFLLDHNRALHNPITNPKENE